jgi:ribosomal protein S12 methylthiotransferase
MDGKVPKRTIERRWREVMAIQKRISREQNKKLIGKRLEVLVEGMSPETDLLLVGRHQGQAPEIDGQVYINEGVASPGELVTVEVTEAHDYDLVGHIVSKQDPSGRRHKPRARSRTGEKLATAATELPPR